MNLKHQKSLVTRLTSLQPEYRLLLEPSSSLHQKIVTLLRSQKSLRGLENQLKVLAASAIHSKKLSPLFNLKYEDSTKQEYLSLFKQSQNNLDEKSDKSSRASGKGGEESESNESEDEKKKRELEQKLHRTFMFTIFSTVFFLTMFLWNGSSESSGGNAWITWNEFFHSLLLKGEVEKITLYKRDSNNDNKNNSGEEDYAVVKVHNGAIIDGKPSSRNEFLLKVPKGFDFEERVRSIEDALSMKQVDRVSIEYQYPSKKNQYIFELISVVVMLAIGRYMMKEFTKNAGKGGKGGSKDSMMEIMTGGMSKAKFTRGDISSKARGKAISFKDVAGLREAKIEVMEFVSYLTKPDLFRRLGAKTPRGALLLGPPGCGKTLLAKALATEAKVPFLAMAGSEFVEMVGGVGASRVRSLFKEAREKAPCIIYIDEIDAVGKKRSTSTQGGGGESEQTLNQLLVEMDGMGTQEGVLVLAATNRAEVLDKALLRAGRFDRHIMIDLPTLAERVEVFDVYLNKLKLAQPACVYSQPLARLTPGMSGADIANICNEAAIHAARDKVNFVDKHDFEYAVERVIAGPRKKSHFLPPAEKKVVAYHECGHALVGWMLKHTDALLKVSIVPRTTNVLGFAQYLPSDQKLYSQQELFERMCMALGGRAAESLIFNHVSSGAQDDLKRVTQMAYAQIRSYGMNARIGPLSFPEDSESNTGTKPFSNKLAGMIDEEARMMVNQAFLHTQKVLEDSKDKLHILAKALLENEVLDYHQIQDLIGAPPNGKKNIMEPQGWENLDKRRHTD